MAKTKGPLNGLYDGSQDMQEKINPWWHKLEKSPFDGMAPRKEYDQVAQDLIDNHKDADVKLISNAVLRREYEF